MSDSLQLHGLQHTRIPCPSLSPRVCSNSCPLNQWYHPTNSSSLSLFSSCLHLSQHQSLFQWVHALHQVAKVLKLQLQYWKVKSKSGNHSVMPDSMWLHGLEPARLLCPRNCPSKNTGVGCHALLQGIFLTQVSNSGLLHCRQILYQLSYPGRFSFNISPSSEYSELISFRIKCFDFLAVQRTLKILLQHRNLKASILQPSVLFIVQLSHPYMTTAKP